jgi:superfamily II DNA or RNA helicase
MFDAFKPYESKFTDWIIEGYPGVKPETRDFIQNIVRRDRNKRLWKNQEKGILRAIYSHEVLGKKNVLLNIVTGGGKTLIIASVMAWLKMAHGINKFLVLVPNLIVRDRLEVDFREAKVFKVFELFPKGYEQMANELGLHTLQSGGNPQGILNAGVIIGNIQQFYSSNISGQRNIAYIMNYVGTLAIFNDEAHNTPAPEYSETLSMLSPKCLFRLDTTATPDRADGQTPDSEMVYYYGISEALEDGIVKSTVVYEPEVKAVELTYTNSNTGEKRKVTELDEDFRAAEEGLKPFQWILDLEPMKKQMAIALDRLKEQRKRAAERFKPVLFVVTMSINEAGRAKRVLEEEFKVKTLLVTQESEDKEREEARKIGTFESKYDAVVSVLMLREGWDVPQVSVILLLRKFSSPVYGQQVIGRGLRRVLWDQPEILAVVDHPRLQHEWLWRLVGVSKVRQNVLPNDEYGNEDLPEHPRIQKLVKPENFIVIPDPEYETKLDISKIDKEIPSDSTETNWSKILNAIEYPRDALTISKVRIEHIQKRTLGEKRTMEIVKGPSTEATNSDSTETLSVDEKRERLKQEVLSIARGLLQEAGYGGLKTGILYNVIMDHLHKKIFRGKSIANLEGSDLDFAFYCMETVRTNFTPKIIAGIMSDSHANK